MDKQLQTSIAARLYAHIDAKSTDRSAAEMRVKESEYKDSGRAVRERAFIARKAIMVASSDELAETGQFYTTTLGGLGVLVVRQEDGSVRAFRNVCRHRCATVESAESGRRKSFSCPYHGWTYGLDGTLLRIPDEESFTSVDMTSFGLKELAIAERHGMVWVVADSDSPLEIEKYFGADVDSELADLKLETYKFYRAETFDQPANWKLIMDGFLEVYHVRYLHPTTVGKISMSNILVVDELDQHLRLVSARKDITKLRAEQGDDFDLHRGVILTYILLPSTVVVYVRDHVEIWTVVPHESDPGRSTVTLRFLIPEHPETDSQQRYWKVNWDTVVGAVQNEDWQMARTIQKNLDGECEIEMILGRNELGLHRFHRYVREEVGTGND
jgi:phenylpropionate dioxygenase-like ring-hydroxylating dioxygenase large terminal subunit